MVPQYSTRRLDGSILTHFDPPFKNGGDDLDYPAKVEHLQDQYTAFVERSWEAAPESVRFQIIDLHMHRPLAEE